MIYILDYQRISQDIIDACGSAAIANILNIMKTALSLIQLVGPILCMVALAINFTRLMTNPEEKKYKAALKNCLIALVVLFMVPLLINVAMSLADESFNIAKCWNNAAEVVAAEREDSGYVDTSSKPKQEIISTPETP